MHGDAGSRVDVRTAGGDLTQVAARNAQRLWTHRQWTPLAAALAAIGDRWTLLIVAALAPGETRLTRLRERLPGISTGVLDNHVRRMTAVGLLSRRRFREMPPRVEVELTDAGRALLPIASALARWGMGHLWSEPQEGEQVDVSALLRMLPSLLEEHADLPAGTVEAVLVSTDNRVSYVFQVEEGHLQATDETGDTVTAGIEGDEQAWIAALGPARDGTGLRFTGKTRLAKRILEAFPEPA